MIKNLKQPAVSLILLMFMCFSGAAMAEDTINGADTAWIMVSTALVLFMTLPGLALFYGGNSKTLHKH